MYERFTDRARNVLKSAGTMARSLGAQKIEPEHILLALADRSGCVAENVLKNLDAHPCTIRDQIVTRLGAPPAVQTLSQESPMPQSSRAKKVIEHAMDESRALCHNYVGTEHLLLAILREGKGIACETLVSMGVTLEETRKEVRILLGLAVENGVNELVTIPPDVIAEKRLGFFLQRIREIAETVDISALVVRGEQKKTRSS